MQEWTALVAAGVLALVAVALVVALLRLRARTDAALAQARAETEELRRRVDELDRPAPTPRADREPAPAQEFVITRMGHDDDPAAVDPLPAVPAPVFVDLVVRESAVRAGSLVAGLRRALAPETRHRIRFEMRREVKRSRRQRKVDTRAALRAWRARERAGLDPDERGSAA